ncbi:MAG: permease-like cell division protein FtsX [Muribaculum sp.]|nr:permease-like cell division protein FtsX [Muribaculum sp.]
MKSHKEVNIPNKAAHVTTAVSVTLALLTLGIIAMIRIAATVESRRMLEKIEISVILADSIADQRALNICDAIDGQPFALDTRFISRQEAMLNWKKATGEDLEKTFGVNPLSPEIAFTVNNSYTSSSGIAKIKKAIEAIDGVTEVGAPDGELIEAMNHTIRQITIGLTILAAVMLVISFILINNTVRLSIYSRRFTIHTMQLVGATNGFIRRPFVAANTWVGVVSGVIASCILSLMLAAAPNLGFSEITDFISWKAMGMVAVTLIVVGAAICAAASALATTRHLRQDYEELFS